MTKHYLIDNKVYKEILDTSENVCMSVDVIKEFCENNKDIYEIRKISPIIKYIFQNADRLFSYFSEKQHARKHEKISFKM